MSAGLCRWQWMIYAVSGAGHLILMRTTITPASAIGLTRMIALASVSRIRSMCPSNHRKLLQENAIFYIINIKIVHLLILKREEIRHEARWQATAAIV